MWAITYTIIAFRASRLNHIYPKLKLSKINGSEVWVDQTDTEVRDKVRYRLRDRWNKLSSDMSLVVMSFASLSSGDKDSVHTGGTRARDGGVRGRQLG